MTKTNIKIAPSSVINYGGLDCIVLDVEQDKILVLASHGVRPAFYLKSSILESLSPSLSEFTTEELLKEVLRRNAESTETE